MDKSQYLLAYSQLQQMQDYYADELGVLSPNQLQVDQLYAGEVKISYLTYLIPQPWKPR